MLNREIINQRQKSVELGAITKALKTNDTFDDEKALPIKSKLEVLLPIADSILRSALGLPGNIPVSPEQLLLLEAAASNLWNAATINSRSSDNPQSTLARIKLFAAIILRIYDLANPTIISNSLRSLKCFMKLFESCVDSEDIVMCKKVQDHVDTLVNHLLRIEADDGLLDRKDLIQFHKMRSCVMLSNLRLSILIKDYDMAKFYESKMNLKDAGTLSISEILEQSRIIYNASTALFKSGTISEALYFVNSNYKLLESTTQPITNEYKPEYNEIRLKSYILLIQCLNHDKTEENRLKIKKTIQFLQNDYPKDLDVYLLSLENLKDLDQEEISNPVELENLMMKLVMHVPTVQNFSGILNILKCIDQKYRDSVLKCLDYLFSNKLDPFQNHEELEIVFTTRIWITVSWNDTGDRDEIKATKEIENFFKLSEKTFNKVMSRKSRAGVIAMIWKQGSSLFKLSQFQEAIGWLNLGLSRILYSTTDATSSDRGKILRMIQNCQINLGEYDHAISTHGLMNPNEKANSISQYYLFQCYVKLSNEEKAIECFNSIIQNEDEKYILTAAISIMESKKKFSKESSIQLILKFLRAVMKDEKQDHQKLIQVFEDDKIIIPVLLRSSLVMISEQLDKVTDDMVKLDNYLKMELEVFHIVMIITQRLLKTTSTVIHQLQYFTCGDLEWFSSKAFNIGCISLKYQKLDECIQFCNYSIEFNKIIPKESNEIDVISLETWYIKASILMVLATSLKNPDDLTSWNKIRLTCSDLKVMIDNQLRSVYGNDNNKSSLLTVYSQVQLFRFQAELILGIQDTIINVIDECDLQLNDSKLIANYHCFGELILNNKNISMKTRNILLVKLIDKGLTMNDCHLNNQIMCWIRRIYEQIENSTELCQQIFTKLYVIIRGNKSNTQEFPLYEIEWLATSCWNHGISLLM